MSNPKHTPGPWRLSEETIRNGLKSRLVNALPEGMIAIVRTEHQGQYYGSANANLIAAAPDLLSSLKAIMELTDDPANDADPEESEFINARRVIAMAEGRDA